MYFTSAYILLSLFSIPFTPISPVDINISGEYVNVQWEILEEGYEYKLEILTQPRCNSVKISFPYTTENSQEVKLSRDGEYCWRLKYRKLGDSSYSISDTYNFTYTQDIPVQEEDTVEEQTSEEEIEEEDIQVEERDKILQEENSPINSKVEEVKEEIQISAEEEEIGRAHV